MGHKRPIFKAWVHWDHKGSNLIANQSINQSPPSHVKDKNEWSYTSTHGVDRENFTFYKNMQLVPFWYLLPLLSLQVNLITFMRFLQLLSRYAVSYYILNADGTSKSFNKPAMIFETHIFMYGHMTQSNILSDHIH